MAEKEKCPECGFHDKRDCETGYGIECWSRQVCNLNDQLTQRDAEHAELKSKLRDAYADVSRCDARIVELEDALRLANWKTGGD